MSTPKEQGQKDFAQALQQKLNAAFSSQLNGKFCPMNVPNGFYWGIQYGPNNYYNNKALDQMNLQPIMGSNDMMTVGGSDFITQYNGILQNIVYAFSPADQKTMATEASNASNEIQSVIDTWETDMGTITPTEISDSKCVPANKLGYIAYKVQDTWGGDVNKIPSAMNQFKMAYQTYQVAAQVSFQLQSASAAAMAKLVAARANSLNGTAKNGGLQTGATNYHAPFGPFPRQNKINGDLQTLTNKAEIKMSMSQFSSKQTSLKVSGGASFSIPVLDLLSIDFGASASYSLDTFASSGSSVDIDIVYEGITFVGAPLTAANLTTNNLKGWYDNQIITQAIGNTDQSQTGYSLTGSTYPVSKYFGTGKEFARIKTWVISQQPKISMTFCNADTSSVTSHFQENASVGIKLFGLFNIGGAKQSYSVSKVDTTSKAGCVTVEMGPSKIIGTTPSDSATAYVIGGVPSYPPSDI